MIITGDIACPTGKLSGQLKKVFDDNPTIFKGKSVIVNFEGLIGEEALLKVNEPLLYNHVSVLESFGSFSSVVACLANNHILDLPNNFDQSIAVLQEKNIYFTGAGKSSAAAYIPAHFKDGEHEVIVFNECWDFLLYHQKNPANGVHIATIQFDQLAQRVQQCKVANPAACIIVYLHWSLDLETLPYPMYRQFSKALIDAGAAVVAGCHSHCVQGGEQYKEGYIIYGLGNFFIPNHTFANGNLFYPPFSATQLVLEYEPQTKKAFCHWFHYEKQQETHAIAHIQSSPFNSSVLLQQYSPYGDMEQEDYIIYFKKNRRKKLLIPLFTDYQNTFKLKLLTGLLKTRARFARMMAKLNLIKWGS